MKVAKIFGILMLFLMSNYSIALPLRNEQPIQTVDQNTCEKQPRLKFAAEQAAAQITSLIKKLPNGLEGFDSIQVANVGSGSICDSQWATTALGFPMLMRAQMNSCGVIYYFKNKDALKSFAKNYIALQSQGTITIDIIKEGHVGNLVSLSDMAPFSIPICAAVKQN